MLTFIAFVITMIGAINWLLIGLLQYDFIAGLFGFQASIFSRMVYIIFGISAVYLVVRVIANKGTFKVYERRKKKQEEKEEDEMKKQNQKEIPTTANVEAGKEQISRQNYSNDASETSYYPSHQRDRENHFQNGNETTYFDENQDSLFDEHFRNEQ